MKAVISRLPQEWLVISLLTVLLAVLGFAGATAALAALAILMLGIAAFLFYRSPISLVGWMIITGPLVAYRGPFDINPFRVFLGIALVVLALIIATRPRIIRFDIVLILAIAFLVKQSQALGSSQHLDFAQKDFAFLFVCVLAMATASFLVQFSGAKPRQLFPYFLAGITLIVLLNLYEIIQRSVFHAFWVTLPYSTYTVQTQHQIIPGVYRTCLPLATPNHYASYAATAIFIVAGIIRSRRQRQLSTRGQLWAVLLMIPLGVSYLWTFSRSAMINVLVGTGFLFGRRRGGRGFRAAVAALILIPLLATAVLTIQSVAFGISPDLFLKRLTLRGYEGTGLRHHLEWKYLAIDLWKKHPILGAGLHEYGPYAGQRPGTSRAHSVYFTILAESGLLGLALFLLFLLSIYRMSSRAIRLERDDSSRLFLCHMTAAFVGFTVSSMFYDFFMDQEWWWWYMGILHGFYALTIRNSAQVSLGASAQVAPGGTNSVDQHNGRLSE